MLLANKQFYKNLSPLNYSFRNEDSVRVSKICIFLSHFSLVIISFFYYNFQRSLFQILSCYAVSIILELLLYKFTDRYKNDTVTNRILSALIEAAGLLVLIRSQDEHYYYLAASIAIASKYFLLNIQGKHLFNPTNLTILVSLALFPIGTINLASDEFSYSLYPILHVLFFGLLATLIGRTFFISFSYLVSTSIFALILANKTSMGNFIDVLGPELGATSLVYIFLMITDPAISPRTIKGQVLLGTFAATFILFLRFNDVVYAHYVSLFCITMLLNWHRFIQYFRNKSVAVSAQVQGQ